MTAADWISTGKAAALLGYNRDYFRDKFLKIFQDSNAVIRCGCGHYRWSIKLVMHLRTEDRSLRNTG